MTPASSTPAATSLPQVNSSLADTYSTRPSPQPNVSPSSPHTLAGPARSTRFSRGELPFWLTLCTLTAAGLVLAWHLNAQFHLHSSTIFLLVALCCFSVGATIGFLFGIPHTTSADQSATNQSQPSTSLEQVSDWLTKIIIGMGLVELAEIEAHLATLGKLIGQATSTHMVVPQLLVIIFTILGFLAGYIWTRIYYDGIQARADSHVSKVEVLSQRTAAIEQRTHQLATETAAAKDLAADSNQRARATAAATTTLQAQTTILQTQGTAKAAEQDAMLRQAIQSSAAQPVAPPAALPEGEVTDSPLARWTQQLAQFMAASPDWHTDPCASIFGALPSIANQRQLNLAVVHSSKVDGRLVLFLKAQVTGMVTRKLDGQVTFLLHPACLKRAVEIPVEYHDNEVGCATYSFFAEFPFTLVAMTDAGATVLSFNLAQLEPTWVSRITTIP